jgi:hypothetical protein
MNHTPICRASSWNFRRLHGFLFVLAALALITSCRKSARTGADAELTVAKGSIPFTGTKFSETPHIALHALAIQSNVYRSGTRGIWLELTYSVSDPQEIQWPAGAEGLVMGLQPQWQTTLQPTALQEIPPSVDLMPYLQLLLPRGEIEKHSGKMQRARWHLPYAEIHLPPQALKVVIKCNIQPYAIPRDSLQQRVDSELRLLDSPWASWQVACNITPPTCRYLQFTMNALALDWNPEKARKQDFSFLNLGKGYPDLCYSLIVGRTAVFRSSAQRNALAITEPMVSSPFFAAEGDSILCLIADDDRVGADEVLHQCWVSNWQQMPITRTYTKSPIQQMRYTLKAYP